MTIGENGIITKAQLASFMQEMTAIREKIDMKKASELLDHNLEYMTSTTFTKELTPNDTDDFEDTLIFEIVYHRSLVGAFEVLSVNNEMVINIDKLDLGYVKNFYKLHREELATGLYYIDPEYCDNKTEQFIYDSATDIAYKIKSTKIGKKRVHSIEFLNYVQTGEQIEIKLPESVAEEGEFESLKYYTPNYKGFTIDETYVVYYNKEDLTDTEEVKMKDYIAGGKKREITKDNKTYVAYDYENKIWANVRTISNGKEGYWTWIPRYSYQEIDNSTFSNINIKFIDTDNKYYDKTDNQMKDISTLANYKVHTAFDIEENGKTTKLQGIWASKYEPTFAVEAREEILPYYIPDLSGFNPDNTYIEIYDEETGTFIEEVKYADIQSTIKEFTNNKLWFDYDKSIWANVKTVTDGKESWWVWVPRYAYSIMGNQTKIKFIDLDDNPLDGSSLDGYLVHSAFNVDNKKLKGIWVSKYEPTIIHEEKINQNVNKPNMIGYNVEKTYIELYDSTGNTIEKEVLLKDVITNSSTVTNNVLVSGGIDEGKLNAQMGSNKWYDYNNKIWANIKTVNNSETAYWTWIPRYSYSLIDGHSNIVFTNTNDEALTAGVTIDALMIPHAGFNIGGQKLEGIWVSKYEPTGTVATEEEATNFTGP